MAKGKRGTTSTRDPLGSLTVTLRSSPRASLPIGVDDRRTFDFDQVSRPARLFTGSTATTTATAVPKKTEGARSRVPYQIAFTAPKQTLVCVRRQRRKEVLFAKKKGGKRGQKKPRRSAYSNVRC